MPAIEVRQGATVAQLLERVREIAPVLEAGARESEDNQHLAQSSVDALHEAGFFRLWWPEELGGTGADIVDGIAVTETLAEADTVSSWNLNVGTTHAGFAGAYLPDHAIETMFANDRLVVAGQMAPMGKADPVEGGIKVTGRWSFGSGIQQAGWVLAGATLQTDSPHPICVLVTKENVNVDNESWQVAGLSGTGSCDYAMDGVFVPDGFWFRFPIAQRLRGGPVFDLPISTQVVVLHAGFALGAAKRALNEITELAKTKARQFSKNSIAQRPTFQTELAESHARLAAARLYVYDVARRTMDAAGTDAVAALSSECRLAARYVTDVAIDIATFAYRSGGGSALRLNSPLQRIVRDLLAASQHVYVDEVAYTDFGAKLVEVTE